jgi:hypothetical protein
MRLYNLNEGENKIATDSQIKSPPLREALSSLNL